MLKEFKEFAMKGNVIDLAVGVIIGAAFNGIVKSLVDQVIMPPIGLLTGGLDFSKLEAGKMVLEVIDFDLPALLRDVVDLLAERAETRGLALVLDIDPGLPRWWRGCASHELYHPCPPWSGRDRRPEGLDLGGRHLALFELGGDRGQRELGLDLAVGGECQCLGHVTACAYKRAADGDAVRHQQRFA